MYCKLPVSLCIVGHAAHGERALIIGIPTEDLRGPRNGFIYTIITFCYHYDVTFAFWATTSVAL